MRFASPALLGCVCFFASPAFAQNDGVLPKSADGRTLNFNFETGDLTDWKVEGDAFKGQPVEGDLVGARRTDMKSGQEGRFWIGGFEKVGDKPTGVLTSVSFPVTHTFASFLIGGGPHVNTVVQLVRADTGREIFQVSGMEEEDLQRIVVDLFAHRGKEIFIRVIDKNTGHWGHVNFDDFRFHDARPTFKDRRVGKLDVHQHAGLDPEAAARAMTVPEGFEVKLFAGEPDVRQPIAFSIDDRGRLWVVENFTYPHPSSQPKFLPAGRKPTFKGKDRILIFEDTDGDGKHDKRTVFFEGLEMASGIEFGFGGVFVGAAPYLLHIPDKDGDDKPDGEPVVLLDGWSSEDTHETLNSFKWGMDGWLYGCHGVFTHSQVGVPGTERGKRTRINAGIWRYHPTRKVFDLFAEGTSNPWGVDYNAKGDWILTCCVIPHLFHVFPAGRFDRQAGSHFNPFTFDDIQTIAKHRHWIGSTPHSGNGRSDEAGGGHAHSGCMVYQGGTWPKECHGKIFMNNIHGARINVDVLSEKGSGYEGDRFPDFLKANDSWSQILNLQYGPDGNVYMIDWYDANQCHRIQPQVHDPRNGRIFKVVWKGGPKHEKIDLGKESYEQLVQRSKSPNHWHWAHARRIVQERAQAEKIPVEPAVAGADEAEALRSLWWIGSANPDLLVPAAKAVLAKRESPPNLRGWAAWALVRHGEPADFKELVIAASQSTPVERRFLAAAATKLPAATKADPVSASRADLVSQLLAHGEDATDHNLPLLYWYAAEPLAAADPSLAMTLALEGKIPTVWEFMARRIAALDSADGFAALAAGLAKHGEAEKQKAVLRGINFTLLGRRNVPTPKGWAEAAGSLLQSSDAELRGLATSLSAKFGDLTALAILRKTAVDRAVSVGERKAALASLVGVRDKELPATLYALLFEPAFRKAAIQALGGYADPKTPEVLIAAYPALPADEKRDALAALAAREPFALALLDAVAAKKIAGADVSADVVRQLRNLQSATLDKRIADVWGMARESSADKQNQIAKFKTLLAKGTRQPPDVSLGRALFTKHCGNCHTLFDYGAKTAPELTGSNRANLDYMLANVVDPNALIGKDYLAHRVQLADGRVLTAIIKSQSEKTLTLLTANETLTIAKSDVEAMKESKESLMPEKLLEPLSEHELRSLVKYLASPAQVPLPPGFKLDAKK